MRVFLLEDDAQRIKLFTESLVGHDVTIALNYEEAKASYKPDPPYDILLLDHDLGGRTYVSHDDEEEDTGSTFCRWLRNEKPTPEPSLMTIIHSYNPDGARLMHAILEGMGWHHVIRMPFSANLLTNLRLQETGEQRGYN